MFSINPKSKNIINEDNYYSDYRAAINIKNLQSTQIIQRGKDRFPVSHFYAYSKSNYELDFTIYETFELDFQDMSCYFILPMNANVKINGLEELTGGYNYNTAVVKINLETLAYTENEKHFKVITYEEERPHTRYNIHFSMSPTEKFIYDKYQDNNANETSSGSILYMMASIQDIKTIVNINNGFAILVLIDADFEEIYVDNDIAISSPFLAYPYKNYASFTTHPTSKLKEGYTDNYRDTVQLIDEMLYFHKKYGSSYAVVPIGKAYDVINIYTKYNVFYVHNYYGRRGEILDKNIPDNQRQIGPDVGITAWYLYEQYTTHEFLIFPLIHDRSINFQIRSSKCYDEYSGYTNDYIDCDRYAIFNDDKSKYKIKTTNENGVIHMDEGSTLCLMPAKAVGEFEITVSNDGADGGWNKDECYADGLYKCRNVRIINTNPSMEVDVGIIHYDPEESMIQFDHKTFGEPYYYSEFDINKVTGVHLINNTYVEHEKIISDSEIELFNYTGYKIVDMTNKKTITIKCPLYTLIFIHNLNDIHVECFRVFDFLLKLDFIHICNAF